MRLTTTFTLLAISVLLSVTAAAQGQWPSFRGADARGIGSNAGLPTRWSATENVEWKTDLPGRGWSSPIVWNNRVFLTTVVNLGESETPQKGLYFGGERPGFPTPCTSGRFSASISIRERSYGNGRYTKGNRSRRSTSKIAMPPKLRSPTGSRSTAVSGTSGSSPSILMAT